ncbi:MAG: TlpA family protein disulfide reductase [Melioribacteraceae bacterium]|nr:TlpA family protein disulfide reductase [Melioribacteraceae bacterium]
MYRLFLLIILLSTEIFAQNSLIKNLSAEDIDGNLVNISSLNDKGLYINFWALWCLPCRSELKILQELFNEYNPKGIGFVGINIDSPKSLSKVKSFISTQKISFPILLDPNSQILNSLNGQNIPYSLLINQNGEIIKIRTGYNAGDEKYIRKDLDDLLLNSK